MVWVIELRVSITVDCSIKLILQVLRHVINLIYHYRSTLVTNIGSSWSCASRRLKTAQNPTMPSRTGITSQFYLEIPGFYVGALNHAKPISSVVSFIMNGSCH